MHESVKDCFLAIVLFSVGLAGLLYIQYGPGEALQNSRDAQITFRSFPTAISGLLMLLTGIYAVASGVAWLKSRHQEAAGENEQAGVPGPAYLAARVIGLVALLVIFALTIGMLPLFVLASIFLFIAFFIFGQTEPLRMGVIALLGGGFFHGLFVLILDLPLN
ncbi:MAG: tripartite tricarboxylate transporter TctB family protein [Rhodospirillales bacterium]